MRVLLTGSTGFVGSNILGRLLSEGHSVHALVRDQAKTAKLPNGNVNYMVGDVVSGDGLDQAAQQCDAVIHLVGIIAEKGSNTFEAVHHLGTRNVVQAAKRNGIRVFIHMSALGVRAGGVARYQITKWKAEEEVRHSGVPYCILRPSLIFGPGDGFVSQMMDVMRRAPLFRPVPGNGRGLYRPVYIGDVSLCIVRALSATGATNQTIALGGAEEVSLNQLLQEIARCAGIRKSAVHVPLPLMFVAAALAQTFLSNPPVTIEQLRMLREGSTCDISCMRQVFQIEPRAFAGCGRTEVSKASLGMD